MPLQPDNVDRGRFPEHVTEYAQGEELTNDLDLYRDCDAALYFLPPEHIPEEPPFAYEETMEENSWADLQGAYEGFFKGLEDLINLARRLIYLKELVTEHGKSIQEIIDEIDFEMLFEPEPDWEIAQRCEFIEQQFRNIRLDD